VALRKRAFFDAAAAALATRGAEWRAIPLLETRSASFDRRFASVSAGKRAQVPYPRLLSRFLKERFPAKTIGGRGDPMWIDFDIAPDAHLSIAITKIHHWGLGKAFTLGIDLVPVNHVAERILFPNLFLLYGTRDEPCWTYQTAEDLSACLAAMGDVIETVVAACSESPMHILTLPGPDLIASMDHRPDCTARVAYTIARPLAATWAPPKMVGVVNTGLMLGSRQEPAIDDRGQLAAHGAWQLHFRHPRDHVLRIFEVPALGQVRSWELTLPAGAVGTGFGPGWRPIPEGWVDSSVAMSLARRAGGDELLAAPLEPFFISCRLGSLALGDGTGPWTIHYCGLELTPRRRDLLVTLEPQTGDIASVRWQ